MRFREFPTVQRRGRIVCNCNCDPCWSCGTRPKQGIISGSVLSYSTPENATYDVYTYGEQDTEQLYNGVYLNSHNHGFGLSSAAHGGAGICSAFNARGGPFFAQAYNQFSQLFDVYGWKIGTRSQPYGNTTLNHDLLLKSYYVWYFVGGEWFGTSQSATSFFPSQATVDRFAGGRNGLGISSRRAMVALVFNYDEIAYYGGVPPYYSNGGSGLPRVEFFEATLPAPCRDYTGTLTLTGVNATWSYAPTTGGFFGNWSLDNSTIYKTVELVF